MHSSMLYAEMNGGSVVPSGGFSPGGHSPQGSEGYGSGSECQVPSPSQWSDPCYSPPSLHSPQHLPNDLLLDKIKEEPYSPPPPPQHHFTGMPSPPPGVPQQQQQGHHQGHPPPYARPQQQQPSQQQQQMMQPLQTIKKEGYEVSVNLLQLLAENNALTNSVQHHQQVPQQQQQQMQQHKVPQQIPQVPQQQQQQQQQQKVPHQHQVYYPDHPLLRERLEDDTFQMNKSAVAFDPSGLSFLDSLVEVKKEVEEEVSVGSVCGSPAAPSPGVASPPPGQQSPQPITTTTTSDILETVELLALEHARRDLQRVSDSLGIPRDPAQWSVDDVRSWLKLQASQLQLPPLMLDFWNLAGPALLKLTEAQFRQLAPVGGELLHAQLEIWHQALRFSATPYYHHQLQQQAVAQQQQQAQQQHQQQQLHNMFMAHQHHLQQQQAAEVLVAQQHQQQQQQQQAPQPPSGSGGIIPLTIQVPGGPQQSPPGVGPPHSPPQPSAGGMNSPQQGNAGGVYLEEACLDMAALLASGGGTIKTPSPQQGQQSQGGPQLLDNVHHQDNYDSDEEDVEETCSAPVGRGGGTHIHLWQFLKELLQQPQLYGSCIRWLDRQKGIFKIEDSVRVARLWGKRKNRPAMNYDKLSRSIRQYYKKGIMKKTERSQRLVYQFCHPYCL